MGGGGSGLSGEGDACVASARAGVMQPGEGRELHDAHEEHRQEEGPTSPRGFSRHHLYSSSILPRDSSPGVTQIRHSSLSSGCDAGEGCSPASGVVLPPRQRWMARHISFLKLHFSIVGRNTFEF